MSSEENLVRNQRLVAYTDGAAKPSRGYWGSGYFGYTYDINKTKETTSNLPKKIVPTTHGLISPELIQEEPKFYKQALDVPINQYVIGSIAGYEINTNSYAEVYAFYALLLKVREIKDTLCHMLIFLDSQMLIHVIKQLLENPSPDYKKYAFPDRYKEIHTLILEYQALGIKIVPRHTYGHSFSMGNQIADRLAFMGRVCCEDMLVNKNDDNHYRFEKIIKVNESKDDFWNKFELEPYIFGKNLYFVSNHVRGQSPYYVLEYPSETEVGEKNGEILMGSIYTNKGDEIIENIIQKHLTYKPDDGIVFNIEIPNLKHFFTYFYHRVSPDYYLTKENNHGMLKTVEEFTTCRTLRPGSLAIKLLNKFEIHPFILEAFLENRNDERMIVVDLTDQFFKFKKQKDGSLKTECIVNIKTTSITLDILERTMPFSLKTDIPNRNYLKKYELAKDVKCGMVFREITPVCYDYYFVLTGTFPNDEVIHSIWNNYYSSRLYLNQQD